MIGYPGTKSLRLHDLGHIFAVRARDTCNSERHGVARHMLARTSNLPAFRWI